METLMLMLQVGCFGEALVKGMYWKALYWFGAFFLTLAIVKGLRA